MLIVCSLQSYLENEAIHMTREVNDLKIKEAMFDIGNEKAPSPDDFIALFFKKIWDIMGKVACLAIKEFFMSGKLLGEIKATLVTLIPKTNQPKKVSDFRPLVCCNVVYKCISNILTNKIKGGLEKLGDPISPYLFTLIMEVLTLMMKRKVGQRSEFKFHDSCKEIESTHLCFSHDLLMTCHGDHKSVNVINKVLKEFSLASGLNPNINKSTIFFGSVNPFEKKRIMEIIKFVEGIFPMNMNQNKKQKEVRKFISQEKLNICGIIESHIMSTKIANVSEDVFGRWEWCSNRSHSQAVCRILVGWDRNVVKLKHAQCKVEANHFNKQLKEELDKILEDYGEDLLGEEKLLAQKEKIEWLSEGDRNNKYFHQVLKSRKNASKIMGICDENGKWFNEDEVVVIEDASSLLNSKLSENEINMTREVTDLEIKEAMFDIRNEKAPGPDDFTALFFKKI
ncbi:hypothetical protein Tco_0127660 [Tanacetum coccineum]